MPVAIRSSTTRTLLPGVMAPSCISNESYTHIHQLFSNFPAPSLAAALLLTDPYSFSYTTVVHFPGSFPFFLTGTNAAPSLRAITGPSRNPLASSPTTASIFLDESEGIVWDVRWWIMCVMSVSNAMGSRRMGKRSRKVIPYGELGLSAGQ